VEDSRTRFLAPLTPPAWRHPQLGMAATDLKRHQAAARAASSTLAGTKGVAA